MKFWQKHDAGQEKPEVTVRRTPKDEITLPAVDTETVSYYVQEPEQEETVS